MEKFLFVASVFLNVILGTCFDHAMKANDYNCRVSESCRKSYMEYRDKYYDAKITIGKLESQLNR